MYGNLINGRQIRAKDSLDTLTSECLYESECSFHKYMDGFQHRKFYSDILCCEYVYMDIYMDIWIDKYIYI